MPRIHIKRIYEPASKQDGFRMLVDRLWPRGVSKDRAQLDLWLKDIAPSDALRRWFNHDVKKWPEFKKKYQAELKRNAEATETIKKIARRRNITLLYAAKDETHNEAVVLQQWLKKFV